MSENAEKDYKVTATVLSLKGTCAAGHKVGETFEISCQHAGNLCGFFYHALFADLQTFQFGGKMPWWEGNAFEACCPDTENGLTLRLVRTKKADNSD